MVGGGSGAFIGAVHRTAACMDGHFRVVAGCLSSTAERAIASGKSLGLDDCRNYGTWQEMIDGERSLPAHERIDAVAIVTPNFTHAAIAAGFAGAGVNVVCDKPLCMNAAEADAILAAARAGNVVFGVTYTYAGYPMVKQARHLVASGVLGDIRKVVVEYHQGWLASKIEAEGQKQAAWRTDPALAGAGALGDIGSHCEQLITNITGLKIESLCADLSTFVPGRKVDDDVSVLLRLSSGARGIISASQVCEGEENNVSIRVYGSKGGLEWRQSDPNSLTLIEPSGRRSISRGHASLCDAAMGATPCAIDSPVECDTRAAPDHTKEGRHAGEASVPGIRGRRAAERFRGACACGRRLHVGNRALLSGREAGSRVPAEESEGPLAGLHDLRGPVRADSLVSAGRVEALSDGEPVGSGCHRLSPQPQGSAVGGVSDGDREDPLSR